jgi:hypothetical protein
MCEPRHWTSSYQDGNPPPSFVKIDIEGAESAALRSGFEVIAQHRPIFMIEAQPRGGPCRRYDTEELWIHRSSNRERQGG